MPKNYLIRKIPVAKFQICIFIFDLLMATESDRFDNVPFLNPVLFLQFKAFDVKLKDTVGFMTQKRSRTMYFLLKNFQCKVRLFDTIWADLTYDKMSK